MRKNLMIFLVTAIVLFSIRMLYQGISIKRQMPQIRNIAEAQKYAKEVEEMNESFTENLRKRGIINDKGPQLPPGVVEIDFIERLPQMPERPYAGPYEIYLVKKENIAEEGEKILSGNSPVDGKIETPKLDPGTYVIRVPGTPINLPFTVYESDVRGKRVTAVINGY